MALHRVLTFLVGAVFLLFAPISFAESDLYVHTKNASDFDAPRPVLTLSEVAALAKLRQTEEKIQSVVKENSPYVVGLNSGVAKGSGVVVSEDGYILTAGHVLVSKSATESFFVNFPDGTRAVAKAQGWNLNKDIGLLKIETPGKWPHAEMGTMEGKEAGDWCVCLAYPGGYEFGQRPAVRAGCLIQAGDKMQSDCVLVGGDSGGALFDLGGKVIGINSSIGQSVTKNYHMSVDLFRKDWDRLVKGERWGTLPAPGE